MADSPRRHVASPTASTPAQSLSPLVQLLPTGYRDIQPLQKGRGWHTNGATGKSHVSKLRRSLDAGVAANSSEDDSEERVVLPVLSGYDGKQRVTSTDDETVDLGPKASAVDRRRDDDRHECDGSTARGSTHETGTRTSASARASSPSVAAIPIPPTAPRRLSRTESNQAGSAPSTPSFRTRAIAASARDSTSNAVSASADSSSNSRIYDDDTHSSTTAATCGVPELARTPAVVAAEPLDPELTARLWQEYTERTKPKSIDKEAYHRKMQHKYNELKAMRERIARLESELGDTQRERDEARDVAARSAQPTANARWQDTATNGELGATRRQSSPTAHSFAQHMDGEDATHREKAFKLERALAATKSALNESQTHLHAQRARDADAISTLEAKLLLEQQTNLVLSKQLCDASTAFRATTDALVRTQIELEREQIHRSVVMEQIRVQTDELMTDHRRKQLQNRVRTVIRNLGKEALHHKMEALHTRVLTAEQSMRKAQLEAETLRAERDVQQHQLEQILSSSALKYHSLASDGGVPGILERATLLFNGTRVLTNQFLIVQILFDDERSQALSHSRRVNCSDRGFEPEVDAHGNEPFRMHFVCYEPATAQDDVLTFQLRDIERLVPEHAKYLAQYADRKHERLLELADVLFAHIHAGYKNGHLVITESPASMPAGADDSSGVHMRREVNIYRTTRFVRVRSAQYEASTDETLVLTELIVNEVYAASSSELWWLEIHALVLESDSDIDNSEFTTTIDLHQLHTVCAHFGSYRPSETFAASRSTGVDVHEIFSIHEELLEPVLSSLEFAAVNRDSNVVEKHMQLVLRTPDSSLDATNRVEEDTPVTDVDLTSNCAPTTLLERSDTAAITENVLNHRCIVNISDVFYCVRFQELWDAELMLEITMDDPVTLCQYHCVVHEFELVAIARYMFESGAVDEDCATHVTSGLPRKLHAPLCKLLKRHIKPLVDASPGGHSRPSPRHSTMTNNTGEISIASLLRIAGLTDSDSMPRDEANDAMQLGCAPRWSTLERLESDIPLDVIDAVAAQLQAQRTQSTRSVTMHLQRTRRGDRYRCSSGRSQLVLVDIWSGFEGFHGLVIEVMSVSDAITRDGSNNTRSPSGDQSLETRRLVATLLTLDDARRALGLVGSPTL